MIGMKYLCRFCVVLVAVLCHVGITMAQEVLSPERDSRPTVRLASEENLSCKPAGPVNGADYAGLPDMSASFSAGVDSVSFPLAFPPLRMDGTIGYFPHDNYYGVGLWNLHEGFNANLNMSVCASFGKHRYHGAGFGTGVAAMYAHKLTDKLMMAVGGSYDRMSWGSFNENRIGINLMVGYQLTDKVSLYAYGNKVLTPSSGWCFVPPLWWADRYRERFGGMIHVKVNDAVSFSVSVEERRR